MTQRLRRSFQIRIAGDGSADGHAFPAVISSDAPVSREGPHGSYREILSHTPGAVNLERAPLPLVEGHDTMRTNVGIVDGLRLEGGRLRGVVRLGTSARAEELADDIRNRIVRGLSVGYQIDDAEWDDDGETLTATRWTPLETSIVAVPADTSAGFYRSISMPDDMNGGSPSRRERAEARETARAELAAADAERNRAAEIAALGQRHGMAHRVSDWLTRGASLEAVRNEILEARTTRPFHMPAAEQLEQEEREAARGRNTRELIPTEDLRNYSLTRAILAAMPDADARLRREAGFELECSRTIADYTGRAARGVIVPDGAIFPPRPRFGMRTMTVGTASAGGDLVATNLLAEEYINALANEPQVVALGARQLTGLVGNVAIPRETAGLTPTWAGEATDANATQPTFDQPSMTPHDLSATVAISRRLLQQSTPAVDALVRTDLARYLNIGVDAAVINGSGSSNQPLGILNSGISPAASLGAAGGAPTYNALTECVQAVAAANALNGALGWLINGNTMGTCMRTLKIGSTFPSYLWEPGASPLEGMMAGFRARVSNNVPSNLTKTSGSNLSALLFGNWEEVIIGIWGGVDLIVDPYTLSKQGTLQITAWRTVDVLIRRLASFTFLTDCVTT